MLPAGYSVAEHNCSGMQWPIVGTNDCTPNAMQSVFAFQVALLSVIHEITTVLASRCNLRTVSERMTLRLALISV